MARQGGLILRGLGRRHARLKGEERVAVFIHGFMAAGPVFDPMRRHVESEVRVPTTGFTWSPLSPFDAIVDKLERHLHRHVPTDARLCLVGHSMGGLIARWYLQERGGHARTDRLVTLATPHAGTERARRAPRYLSDALRPDGPIIRKLGQTHQVAAHVPHVALVAGSDHACEPTSSAGAVDCDEVVHVDGLGHNETLFDRRVWDVVARALR